MTDRTARCWQEGTEGWGTAPTILRGLNGVTEMGTGWHGWDSEHNRSSCSVLADGTVHCCCGHWLGVGEDGENVTPQLVPGLERVKHVRVNNDVCAIRENGELWCWGGVYTWSPTMTLQELYKPIHIESLGPVLDVALGADFICALLEDHSVWCWGNNGVGQVGAGIFADVVPYPAQVIFDHDAQ